MDVIRHRKISKEKDTFVRHNRVLNWNAKLRLEIVTDIKSWTSVSNEWNKLVEASNIHIFQTFEWLKTWWKYFGEDSEWHNLRILCLYHRDRLVGIAPFFIDHFQIKGKSRYRCLRLIGSTIMQNNKGEAMGKFTYTDYLDLIIHPGYEECVSQKIINYISNTDEFDHIFLEEIPEYSVLFENFIPLLKQNAKNWDVSIENSSVCPVINLQDSWGDFFEGLSSSAREQVNEVEEAAISHCDQQKFKITRITDEEQIGNLYDSLVDFHQDRWIKRGRPGAFARKRKYEFYKEIVSVFNKKGWTQLVEARVPSNSSKRVAIDLIFRFNGTLYLAQRGIDDSSVYTQFNPENLLLYTMIKDGIKDRMQRFDLLRGAEDYTFKPGTHEVQNKNILIRKKQRSKIKKFFNTHLISWILATKRRIRFEFVLLKTHLKQGSSIVAFGRYLKGVYSRAFLKVSELIS